MLRPYHIHLFMKLIPGCVEVEWFATFIPVGGASVNNIACIKHGINV